MALSSSYRTNLLFLVSLLIVLSGRSTKKSPSDDVVKTTSKTQTACPTVAAASNHNSGFSASQLNATENFPNNNPMHLIHSEQHDDASKKGSSKSVAFHLDQESFISQLTECILDSSQNSRCHIIYQHVGKTGGAGIQKLFFGLLGHKRKTCCNDRMQKAFFANTTNYCPNPFQSFHVSAGFDTMVHTCQDQYYKDIKDHKLLLLTTMREPISQTLSLIHQQCNKNWGARDNETKEACTACKFEKHPEYWMSKTKTINTYYENITNQTLGSLKEFDHLFVDLPDLSKMIKMVSERLSPVNEHFANVFTSYFNKAHNIERLDRCSFGLSTQMIKALKPAQGFYRSFTTRGLVDQWVS